MRYSSTSNKVLLFCGFEVRRASSPSYLDTLCSVMLLSIYGTFPIFVEQNNVYYVPLKLLMNDKSTLTLLNSQCIRSGQERGIFFLGAQPGDKNFLQTNGVFCAKSACA